MRTYRIKSGDTLWALSRRFGTTVKALAETNKIADPNLIITGRTLRIPGKSDSIDVPRSPRRPGQVALPDASKDPSQAPRRPGRGTSPRTPTPPRSPGRDEASKVGLGSVPRGQLAQYEYFRDVVKQAGGKFKTGANQFNLVGLRTNTNTTANGGNGSYDDRLAMVWKDAAGKPHVQMLRYNTEPARNMAKYSRDVNGDGRGDAGRLTTGYYEYAKSSWKDGFCLRPTRDYSVQRDMNNNGRWDDSARTSGGGSMLFHSGGNGGTYSAGCQTFPPSEWARFTRYVRAARGNLGYTLVTRGGSTSAA